MEMPWPRPGHWDSVRSDFRGSIWSLHQALAATLKDHKNLKELVLFECQVGDIGAQASRFCYFHRRHFPLFSSSSGRFFTICCMEALVDPLKHNTTLTDLNLSFNQTGDKGVKARVLQCSISFRCHILHIAGFGQCNEAQQEPHQSPPPPQSLWRSRSPGPVSRSVRRVDAPWCSSVTGTGSNRGAAPGEQRSCCRCCLEVDWDFSANSLLRFVFGFPSCYLISRYFKRSYRGCSYLMWTSR